MSAFWLQFWCSVVLLVLLVFCLIARMLTPSKFPLATMVVTAISIAFGYLGLVAYVRGWW